MDWDGLRIFLAVARAGSLSGAAKALRVNHSTVFRRIGAFEEELGVRLFDRGRGGYVLTLAGADLLQTAERIDGEIDAAGRRVTGQDLRLSGPLAVTTTGSLTTAVLGPMFAGFHEAYPGIDLTLLLDAQFFNLSKRQADVAIRPTIRPPDHLVGRRVAQINFAVYGNPAYLSGRGEAADLGSFDWAVPDDSLGHLSASRWLKSVVPEDKVALTTNNLSGLVTAAAAGMGVALIPCFMADGHPALERISGPVEEAASNLWLLTHEDLRRTQRVRAFMDHAADYLTEHKSQLEG